jgi:putative ABC transport system permease protein
VSARLKSNVTVERAASGMRTLGQQLEREQPDTRRGWGINVRPLHEEFVGSQARLVFAILAAAAGAVLLIGCANIANLLLVRGAARSREFAIRAAIGASRTRLIGQMLVEGSVLALLGAAGGVLVAHWGLQLLRGLIGAGQPYADRAVVDVRVLAFAAVAAGVSTLLCALGPAIRSAGSRASSLRSPGARLRQVRGALVAGEVAAAMLLLILAVLCLRTLTAFTAIAPGFDPAHLLTVRLSLPAPGYATQDDVRRFYVEVDRRVARIPGVTDVGATVRIPAAGDRFNPSRTLQIEGRTAALNETWFANDLAVTPGYLAAMRIPVLAGRGLNPTDDERAPLVALVSAAAAQRYWPNGSPVGAHLRLGDEPSATAWRTVVGVVGDIRNDDVDQPPSPLVYVPHAQRPARDLTIVLRTTGEPGTYAAAARAVIAGLDPNMPVYGVQTMEEVLEQDLRPTAVLVGMATLFAIVATALASLGIYGVVARSVAQMRRDLGIRMALGASARGVVALVLREGLTPVLIGAAAGVTLGSALARLLRGVLYGVTPGDLRTYVVAGLVLVSSAVLACIVPALSAARINPVSALRCD